jgi:hypothetical protein
MRYTLNQIVNRLEEFAEKHQQINSFGFGDPWEMDTGKGTLYPRMFAVFVPSRLSKKQMKLNFSILFMDLVKKDESNELEVQSDMLQVCCDLRAYLTDFDQYFTINEDDDLPVEPFTEKFDEELTGMKIDITFKIIDLKDRCVIPLQE